MNILSISLNNHESRIVELEKKNTEIEYFRMENHNWVKKYKNGLIEQGGIVDAKGSQKGQTVTFMEPFSNERYTLVTTSNNGGWGQVSGGWNKTPTSFNTCSWQSANGGYPTVLIGWIAIGILYTYRYIIKSAQKFTPLSYLFNKEV